MEPSELSGWVEIGAAAIDAGDATIPVEEPIQSWVQASRVEDGGGAKE